jgi:hypothetical protein
LHPDSEDIYFDDKYTKYLQRPLDYGQEGEAGFVDFENMTYHDFMTHYEQVYNIGSQRRTNVFFDEEDEEEEEEEEEEDEDDGAGVGVGVGAGVGAGIGGGGEEEEEEGGGAQGEGNNAANNNTIYISTDGVTRWKKLKRPVLCWTRPTNIANCEDACLHILMLYRPTRFDVHDWADPHNDPPHKFQRMVLDYFILQFLNSRDLLLH